MAWMFWKVCNEQIFQHFQQSTHQIARNNLLLVSKYNNIRGHLETPLQYQDSGNQYLLIRNSPNFVSWQPPPAGVLKINFDALITDIGAAAEFVIKNECGHLIRAKDHPLQTFSVLFAELAVAQVGLNITLHDLQAFHIWLVGDYFIVISWLLNAKSAPSHIPMVRDILACPKTCLMCHIYHIFQETN